MPGNADILHANAGRLLGEMLADGQARAEQEGDWVGSYQLCALLGEGGFANVWLAEQFTPVRRKVAVKLIKLGMGIVQVLDDFHLEQQALASISHPNVATMIESGTAPDGRPFFAMEMIRGQCISRWCECAQPPVLERLRLFHQVCLAVHHFHGLGIIHLDLKPGNILVTSVNSRADAKIIDFGIARATIRAPASEATQRTLNLGTPGTRCYMSPEQIGGGSEIDVRSDIYSLGVVLHELVTGSAPSKARPVLRPLSPGLDSIMLRALETKAQNRYQNAAELADDVLRFINNEPVPARHPTTSSLVSRWIRGHRLLVAAACLGVAAVGSCVVLVERPIEPQPQQVARQGAAFSLPKDGLANSLGMKFIPVQGTNVLFCIHETRAADYAAYAAAMPEVAVSWKHEGIAGIPAGEGDNHPVYGVSWQEAAAFCTWLSMKEGRSYRLPTDHEWSLAAGVGQAEDDLTRGKFTQGSGAPASPTLTPNEAGNFAGRTFHTASPKSLFNPDLNDGFATTSPVMSFGSNALGLFDMGGNVWEWVEDSPGLRKSCHTARGGGYTTPQPSLSDHHLFPRNFHGRSVGFRVVLAMESNAAGA